MSSMEQWSFPPRFDNDYLPPAGSRYWFPQRETMDPAERETAILETRDAQFAVPVAPAPKGSLTDPQQLRRLHLAQL